MTELNHEAADRYSDLMEEPFGKPTPMTDKFEPDIEGYFFIEGRGGHRFDILEVWNHPDEGLQTLVDGAVRSVRDASSEVIFFAPVTPSDVVMEMREALAQCAAELTSTHSQYGDVQNAEDHSAGLRMARAVLAKLGKVGA